VIPVLGKSGCFITYSVWLRHQSIICHMCDNCVDMVYTGSHHMTILTNHSPPS